MRPASIRAQSPYSSTGCYSCCATARGTIDGSINTVVDGANIALNCEGSEIAGIGDPKGAGSILLKDAELDMTMLAASVIDVGTRCGSVSTQGGRKSVRINP